MIELPIGWFSDADIKAYRELVSKIPKQGILVEVGVWKGRSLCSIADIISAKRLRVIAVDTFQGSVNEQQHKETVAVEDIKKQFQANIKSFGIEDLVEIVHGDILKPDVISTILGKLEGSMIDLMFVDAEHTFEAVQHTLSNFWEHCRAMAGHDYSESWPAVKQAVNYFFLDNVSNPDGDVWYKEKEGVSIIIPTWNGGELLMECLRSIRYQKNLNTEIIVVNNNPDLKFEAPDNVRVIDHFRKGFAQACNEGARHAKYNYLLFLNDDCKILEWDTHDWVNRLIKPLEDPEVGITGVHTLFSEEFNIDFLVGFCIAVRRHEFLKWEFKERLWGGCEDMELCFRYLNNKQKIVNVNTDGTFPIYHKGEGTLHDEHHKELWQTKVFKENKERAVEETKIKVAIITPTTRPENLVILGYSILKALETNKLAEVVWYVVLNNGAKYDNNHSHLFPFMRVLDLGAPAPFGNEARRFGIKQAIKDNMAESFTHLYYQDDDNEFSEDVFKAIFANPLSSAIFISQYNAFGQLMKTPKIPIVQGEIDTAMIIQGYYAGVNLGWESDVYEADTHLAKKITETYKVALSPQHGCTYNSIEYKSEKSVTAVIPTKGRYATTFALTLEAVINQTVTPKEILIYDDNEEPIDIREWETYKFLLILANKKGIKWELIYAPKVGVWASHEHSISRANSPYIWRIDDDCIPEATVLETLLSYMENGVSAVAGSVLHVDGSSVSCPDSFTNRLDTIYVAPNAQWFTRNNVIEAEHLYSTFLYSKLDALDFRFPPLSRVSFREETMLSLHLSKKGKLLLVPNCVTWHAQASGGVRTEPKEEMFKSDEVEFKRYLVSEGFKLPKAKVFYAANGKGDAEILRAVVDEFIAEGGTPIICAADNNVDVFEDLIVLNSFQSYTMGFGNVGDWNIYNFLHSRNWTKSLYEAYKTFFA